MSECEEYKIVSMTGSSRTGPPQPQQEEPVASDHSPEKLFIRRKMTPVQHQIEPLIQLTPLWEHVVRTQQFPPDVDTCLVFNEISSRLRDPEWEVRQHALRVLVDVIPTLDEERVDEIMEPVVGELINNLGHLAPAVRKGALDTLRVYLLYSSTRDAIVKNIIDRGINRNNLDTESHITLGVILSAPSLVFPSSRNIKPSRQSLKTVINALASRLGDIKYQEVALKSLVKIRDAIGDEFVSYLEDCPGAKEDFDNLSQVYNVHSLPKRSKKVRKKRLKRDKPAQKTSGEKEEKEEENREEIIPPSRVILETEIKFNKETAITMTILEEKDQDSDDSLDSPLKLEDASKIKEESKEMWIERRKTPRRVHFGGEIVKLRTPDSDDSQLGPVNSRIPLPISPVTKMPTYRPSRSVSHPCSPSSRCQVPRRVRSFSASPKRNYIHDGSLNPGKSILSKSSKLSTDNLYFYELDDVDSVFGFKENDRSWSFEIFDAIDDEKCLEEIKGSGVKEKRKKKKNKAGRRKTDDFNNFRGSEEKTNEINFIEYPEARVGSGNFDKSSELKSKNYLNGNRSNINSGSKEISNRDLLYKEEVNEGRNKNISEKVNDKLRSQSSFESFPRKERNYILMELSSPIKDSRSRQVSPVLSSSAAGSELAQSNENTQESESLSDRVSIGELNASVVLSTNETFKEESLNTENSETPEGREGKKVEAKQVPATAKEDKKEKKEINENNKESKKFSDSKTVGKNFDSGNESRTCSSSSEGENKTQEPSWEELGLVDQEVLNDLHNKEDWRARVRGFERVASALRSPSALIAIEPRLGSLLHAVLGCERSCRVAAAGMAVARVVVFGVSEEALKRWLPQVAWGLTRQGGPNAAQIARIAMRKLSPALFLEQLLQPHCIDARNAKTRENALQLLIFSLDQFPSTEFKVENVANKVALMVGDRRRRVRQAALDTLAVLAQIYEPEEVLQAGQRAAKQLKESSDMVAAIRARLARKSLPTVTPDGLVVYGLQISPTVQIATGPDVDWIVAGSGSVSPGTGRVRGQIINMYPRANFDKISEKNDTEENYPSHDGNLVARGIGLHPKSGKPVAWQLVSAASKDENKVVNGNHTDKNSFKNGGINGNIKKGLEDSPSPFISSLDSIDDSYGTEAVNISLIKDEKDVIMKLRKTEENFHRRMDEIYSERPYQDIIRLESRIPVAQFRDRDIVVRHSTAYSRRRRTVKMDEYETSSSAPQSSYGQRDDEINRRYRSDRIKRESRGGSDDRGEFISSNRASPQVSPSRDTTSIPVNRRRHTAFQSTSFHPEKYVFSSTIESRCKSVPASYQSPFTGVQTIDSYSRISSSPMVIKIDKANADEEFNQKNICNSTQIDTQRINNLNDLSSHYLGRDRESYEVSSDSSNDRDNEPLQDHKVNEDNSLRSASIIPKSFDIITQESNPSRRNSIDQIPVTILSSATNSTDLDKETSSDDIASGRELDSDDPLTRNPASGSSVLSNESSSVDEAIRDVISPNRRSGIQAIAFDEHDSPDVSLAYDRDYSTKLQIDIESRVCSSINSPNKFFHSPAHLVEGEKSFSIAGDLDVNEDEDEEDDEQIEDDVEENESEDANRNFEEEEEEEEDEDKDVSEDKIDEMSGSIGTSNTTSFSITGITTTSSLTASTSTSSSNPETVKNLVSIVVASRPHSRAAAEYHETTTTAAVTFQPLDIRQFREETSASGATEASAIHDPNDDTLAVKSNDRDDDISVTSEIFSVIKHPSDENPDTEIHVVTIEKIHQTLTSSRENGTVTEIARIHMDNNEIETTTKRLQSKVPRSRTKMKTGFNKVSPALPINTEKSFNKSKPIIPQCFAQLESNDWEVAIKGLKGLSIIARQQSEVLDKCPQSLVGRLLARHIKNLRSQVARTACMAAGDVFESRSRCLDHDLDEIAGPLLHRTADTNRFLRSDSNAALDRMIEHLPPHRTISVIIYRGASHQNAIVRASTSRLLASVVERMGPDAAMTLPRDVREKLLSSGAKLLMDANLDARNHAKMMFKQLSRCEGFRKALKDSVPDTTLRHIDKTLRSL